MYKLMADELRQMADRLEKASKPPPSPDMKVSEAVNRLKGSIRRGSLEITMTWDDFDSEVRVDYEVRRHDNFKSISSSGSLSGCVQKALDEYSPHDDLDMIDAAMNKELSNEPVKQTAN